MPNKNWIKINLLDKISFISINKSSKKDYKSHPFTDEQIRNRAYHLWEQRGKDSLSEENWNDAIQQLAGEQRLKKTLKVLRPLHRLWWWTGLGLPTQSIGKWSGFQNKNGWDFLQLLIAPLLIAGIGLSFQEYVKQKDTQQQKADRERDIQQQKADKEREQLLAENKIKQDTLTKYLEQMEELLNNGLLKAEIGSDKFIVAQTKTVIALQSLDRNRQQIVIQFLESSGFNNSSQKTDPLNRRKWGKTDRLLLYRANMRKANLVNSDLSGVVLIRVKFQAANLGCSAKGQCSDLSQSDLRGADLQNAILRGANLQYTDFQNAYLSETNIKDADIKNADFREAKYLTVAQVKSAKNWKQAQYSPELRQKLGLPPEQKTTDSSLLDRLN